MKNEKDKLQAPQGSTKPQANNHRVLDNDKKVGEKYDTEYTGVIPEDEIIGSDADKDRNGEESNMKARKDSFFDSYDNDDKKCRRNPWNSITFDTDDFFGTLASV